MLHALRKLAREVHRRSVWQVLAGYLVLWFLAYEAVVLATRAIGLPLWTPAMAFVLLAIGLPIVLATTAVEGGIPGLRIVDEVDPNELVGRTPDEVHVVPEAHPLYGQYLTWRNAILGGVMAAALLLTSVVAYLTMWAFGFGPVASLVAQGILEPGDAVVVAEVVNATDDESMGMRVRRLLEEELARSSLVRVGSPADAKIVIRGEVTPAGNGFRVYARVHLPDGMILAGMGATTSSPEGLAAEVAELALRLRQRFGESLREIHEDGSFTDGS